MGPLVDLGPWVFTYSTRCKLYTVSTHVTWGANKHTLISSDRSNLTEQGGEWGKRESKQMNKTVPDTIIRYFVPEEQIVEQSRATETSKNILDIFKISLPRSVLKSDWILSDSSTSMRACRCRRLKGVCALMMCVTLALHMLVIHMLVMSMFTSTCEPVQRHRARPHNLTSANLTHASSTSRRVGAADLGKLEALFSHALYTLHGLSSPDDDTLLRVRTQVNEEHNAEQWWGVLIQGCVNKTK